MPSRHKMMLPRDKVHVWSNSHPKGGGGQIHISSMMNKANHKHPGMMAQNKNTEDNSQDDSHDDHHRASLFMDINHPWYTSSHHSSKPNKYDDSARVSLQENIPLAAPESTSQIKMFESPSKLYEKLATTPPDRKTSPQDKSTYMDNHSSSPTATTATLKRYEPTKKVKYKDSQSHRKKYTHNVPSIAKFGNPNKTSNPKDQQKMVEYEASHMEFLSQFYIKRNNYNMYNKTNLCRKSFPF